jgi:hypothetical protein
MRLAPIAFGLATILATGTASRADDVEVSVVTILASDRHTTIDPRLRAIAQQIQQTDKQLTGYKVRGTASETVALGHKKSFPLVGDVALEVTPQTRDEKDKRIRLTVKCPHWGEATYTTVPEKFFPMLTRYQHVTEGDKERLIVAVMVRPAPPKDKDKAKDKSADPPKNPS